MDCKYLVVCMSGKFYVREIGDLEDHIDNIQDHISNGDIVLLCDDVEHLKETIGISDCEIVMVEE